MQRLYHKNQIPGDRSLTERKIFRPNKTHLISYPVRRTPPKAFGAGSTAFPSPS